MATAELETHADEVQSARIAAVAGVVFAVLFVIGFLLGSDIPDYDASDQKWIDWFDDRGNRARQVVAAVLLGGSSLAFVVFAAGLGRRLRRSASASDIVPTVALASALLFAALAMAAGTVTAAPSAATAFTPDDFALESPDALRLAVQLGGGLWLGSGWFAALAVFAASAAAYTSGALPRQLVIAGAVVGVLLLFSFLIVPLGLLVLWAIAVSVTMWREPLLTATAAPVAGPKP